MDYATLVNFKKEVKNITLFKNSLFSERSDFSHFQKLRKVYYFRRILLYFYMAVINF